MSIKRVAVGIERKAPKKSPIAEIAYAGTDIARYVRAARIAKRVDADMKALRPAIQETGLKEVFRQNAKNEAPAGKAVISSVILTDERNASIRVTLQEKYSIADTKAVEKLFKDLGDDAGNYVTGGIKIEFDSTVFNHPETGDFDENIYRRYERAIARATKAVEAELRAEGVEATLKTPFTAVETFFVKPEFHAQRFEKFTVAQNTKIQEVIKGTVQLTPIIP